MAGTLVGLALAFLQGACLACWLWPGRARPVLVLAALALPVGLASSSSAYFLWTVASGGRTAWFPALEAGATLALVWVVCSRARRRPGRAVWPRGCRPGVAWCAPLGLAVVTALVGVMLLRLALASPWGYWDAWAMINRKARFLCEGGTAWPWAFDRASSHHPDYPLLLAGSVARLWRWSALLGGPVFTPLQPQALSLVTWFGCLSSLVAVVALLCRPGMAALAGLAFFGLGWDLQWGALQYTDFAQAGYFVWSAGVLALAARRRACAARWWPLLGFLAGATAWCKNEGLAFTAVLLAGVALAARARTPRDWACLAGGGLLPGLAVAVLKLGFAAGSTVFETRSRSVLSDLTDPARYGALLGFVGEHVSEHWSLIAVLVLVLAALLLPGRPDARRIWQPLALLLSITLVIGLVMLTTREDYDWHLLSAVDRLLIQLWPLAILAGSAALRPA